MQFLQTVREAWRSRTPTATHSRMELDFLPAQLELIERPPHPASLWTARTIAVFIGAGAMIAAFGQLDIVAVAQGQIVPSASVKIVQPAVTAVVRRIWVKNGDRVVKGQVLVDLDATLSDADLAKARATRIDALLVQARAQALLEAQKDNRPPHLKEVADAPPERIQDARMFAESAFSEYQHKLAALASEKSKREASLEAIRAEIRKLQGTLPMAEQQAKDYRELATKKYVAAHESLERERIAIDQREELAAQQSRALENEVGIQTQARELEATIATFRREQLEAISQAGYLIAQGQSEEAKAGARQALMKIGSPAAGIVQQLNIHTSGGVVSAGQALMEVVPDDTLEVEARISNQDIGFVLPGQPAIVKITTFPYARYGYLTGTVTKVSNDATTDKRLGSAFLSRIALPSSHFYANGRELHLTSGMEVTAEVKTGKQQVWQYFLSPLVQTGSQSFRER